MNARNCKAPDGLYEIQGIKVKLITIAAILALFSVLAVLIFSGRTEAIDKAATELFAENITPLFTSLSLAASGVGGAPVIIIIALGLLAYKPIRMKLGIPVALTAASSTALNAVLKHVFMRARPDTPTFASAAGFSFPSGHTMNNMAFYTILVLLMFCYLKNKRLKTLFSIFMYVLVLAIGLSRVYLGVHYISDVFGGLLMGYIVAITSILVSGKLAERLNCLLIRFCKNI